MLWQDTLKCELPLPWSPNMPNMSKISSLKVRTIEEPLARVPATDDVMIKWPPFSFALKIGLLACANQSDCLTLNAKHLSQSSSVNASTN